MPIEIKELHIRVTVDSPSAQAPASASEPGKAPEVDKCAQDEMVADVVEQVLQILQEKKER